MCGIFVITVDNLLLFHILMKTVSMNVAVIGVGYVGLVHALLMANTKCVDETICIDVDSKKIEGLKNGISPIYEVGIEEKLTKAIDESKIRFTSDIKDLSEADAIFICVGTPENADGSANMTYMVSAIMNIAENAKDDAVVVIKSTVPVGTNKAMGDIICKMRNEKGDTRKVHMASNPEFLREGRAIQDAFYPDRIVIGVDDRFADDILSEIYHRHENKLIRTSIPSAEMIKYASNTMLAMKISFANEIANLCEEVGADYLDVKRGMETDARIGSAFIDAGCGYGGSCFPKDVNALISVGKKVGIDLKIAKAVDEVNDRQKERLFEKYLKYFRKEDSPVIAVLGLSFKPGTDDVREAPSINLIKDLLTTNASKIKVYDAEAEKNFKEAIKSQDDGRIEYEESVGDTVNGADVVFLVTEWPENLMVLTPEELLANGMVGRIVISGRDREVLRNAFKDSNFTYDAIGYSKKSKLD